MKVYVGQWNLPLCFKRKIGKVPMISFFDKNFFIFFEDKKIHKFFGSIIFISISAWEQKLYNLKCKVELVAQGNKIKS